MFSLDVSFYAKYCYLLNLWWLTFIVINKVYVNEKAVSYDVFLKHRLKIYVVSVLATIIYIAFFSDIKLLRFLATSTVICYGANVFFSHFFYRYFGNLPGSMQVAVKRVLIIGYNNVGKKLAQYFEREQITYCLVGFAENNENITELSNYPIISDIKHTVEIAKKLDINEIFLTVSPENNNDLYNIIYNAESECIRVIVVPDLSFFIQKPVHVQYFGDIPVLLLRSEPLEDISNRFIKRAFDIFVSLLAIIFILSWLTPLIGIFIYLESPGPIFFRQLRTGRNKKQFICIKFRSMKLNNDAHIKQASKGDARVTIIGRIIRKTSLDEFPQFFNVLKGDMSLVGPRPHMLKHTQDYSQLINQFMIRQFLKPGITGWAQVNGHRGEISNKEQLEKRLEHDIWYLENWNFFLDIKIVFLTIFNALKGEENAF